MTTEKMAVPAQELALPAEKLVVPEEPDEKKCGIGESPCPKQMSAARHLLGGNEEEAEAAEAALRPPPH